MALKQQFNIGDQLPFALFCPQAGELDLVWICNYDQARKITSLFMHREEGEQQRQINYLEGMDVALKVRRELKAGGWKEFNPEDRLNFTVKNKDGVSVPLNRKQRRQYGLQKPKSRTNESSAPALTVSLSETTSEAIRSDDDADDDDDEGEDDK